ncbi:response regulator [Nocardiopsis sp. RSe5-2]|uniref:Transcriptional regulatory protein n=1 Tax=Nocardiopsis endophytica TaxID=3018445 RepID=A0ABT4U1Z0_9ACTN|nr:response regulator [Nocardiopsis endophytica]MDA2810963.1 response regulator [Nocardiopsis endophytica]
MNSGEDRIRALIVEDDPRIADAHAQYVERVPGFTAAGVVHRGGEALDFLDRHPVDLVLLDFYLPDMTGLDVCRTLRARGHLTDIIAITSARDVGTVRSVLVYGVVQYLLKPFSFAAFRDKLERYAEYRGHLLDRGGTAAQQDLDRAFGALRGSIGGPLPKGMSNPTLSAVVDLLRGLDPDGITAAEAGNRLGMARVTARRYLEHLAEQALVERRPRYGGQGRPENIYHWNGPPSPD